jgi:hypothetical protein
LVLVSYTVIDTTRKMVRQAGDIQSPLEPSQTRW